MNDFTPEQFALMKKLYMYYGQSFLPALGEESNIFFQEFRTVFPKQITGNRTFHIKLTNIGWIVGSTGDGSRHFTEKFVKEVMEA